MLAFVYLAGTELMKALFGLMLAVVAFAREYTITLRPVAAAFISR